jgi:hypothetical protein
MEVVSYKTQATEVGLFINFDVVFSSMYFRFRHRLILRRFPVNKQGSSYL